MEHVKPTVVKVFFPEDNRTLAYYNDRFALSKGDLVFVEGRLAGRRGVVTSVTGQFKIRLSDYKRVISKADTAVTGTFYQAGSHLLSFGPEALPFRQVLTWLRPPAEEEEAYAVGCDGSAVSLEKLSELDVPEMICLRGADYYRDGRVSFLSLEAGQGRALVSGTEAYTLDFQYRDGEVRGLVCDCPCGYTCKHAVAVLLQLRKLLNVIERDYPDQEGQDFTAVSKDVFRTFALDANPAAVLRLEIPPAPDPESGLDLVLDHEPETDPEPDPEG